MPSEVQFGAGQRVLLACTSDLPALRPALEDCRAAWPEAYLTLLVPARERGHLPGWASSVLTPENVWALAVLDQLRAGHFAAAVILTAPGDSPHGLGYLCALAGIPWRAGVSGEFGGLTLTHWVKAGNADPAPSLLTDLFTPERS